MKKTQILTIVSVIGVFATAVSSAIATRKAIRNLDRIEQEGEVLDKKEAVKRSAKYYIIPLASIFGTSASIICSEKINAKTIAGITASCVALKKSYDKYKGAVEDVFGIEGADLVKKHLRETASEKFPMLMDSPDEEVYYIDYGYNDYFKAKPDDIERAEFIMNKNLRNGKCVSVSDFFDIVGLEPTFESTNQGWSVYDFCKGDNFDEGWLEIKLNTIDGDKDHQACEIEFSINPTENFVEHYKWFKDGTMLDREVPWRE